MKIIIGVSEMHLSNCKNDVLITHALGSCIGICIYDSDACVGGILHYMLPLSEIDNKKASANPFMFGETGIPEFFFQAYKLGAKKENIRVIMVGGAEIVNNSDIFTIGRKNVATARKIFRDNGIVIRAENTGGKTPRTLYLEIGSGKTWIRTSKNVIDLK
jgi:chemotaxis protein CheD